MATPVPKLIDCHVHLQDPVLREDLEGVLARAAAAGVERFVCNGSSEEDWPDVLELFRLHGSIIPCFGLHPWYVGERSERWLLDLEVHLKAVHSGVGEIGLDRWKKGLDPTVQEEVFLAQLDLARRLRRPVMVHCVQAWGRLLDLLGAGPPLPAGLIIHAYGGSVESLKPLLDLGAYFSFAGDTFEERKARKRESLKAVPLERLLLETDAPDMLPPPPYRLSSLREKGRERNDAVNLRGVLRAAAEVRGEAEEVIAGAVWENARRLLGDLFR